jgi:hypothetical protein
MRRRVLRSMGTGRPSRVFPRGGSPLPSLGGRCRSGGSVPCGVSLAPPPGALTRRRSGYAERDNSAGRASLPGGQLWGEHAPRRRRREDADGTRRPPAGPKSAYSPHAGPSAETNERARGWKVGLQPGGPELMVQGPSPPGLLAPRDHRLRASGRSPSPRQGQGRSRCRRVPGALVGGRHLVGRPRRRMRSHIFQHGVLDERAEFLEERGDFLRRQHPKARTKYHAPHSGKHFAPLPASPTRKRRVLCMRGGPQHG